MDSPSYQNISLFPAISSNIAHIKAIFRSNTNNPFDPNNGGSLDSVYIDSTSGLTGTGSFATNSHFTSFYNKLQEGDLFFIKQAAFSNPVIYHLDSKFNQSSFSNGVNATRGFTYTIVQGTLHLPNGAQRNISVERYIDPNIFNTFNKDQKITYQPIIGTMFMYGSVQRTNSPSPSMMISRHTLSNVPSNIANIGNEVIANSGYISSNLPRVESLHYNSFEANMNTYSVSGSSVTGYDPSLEVALNAQNYVYDSYILLGASTFSIINQSDQSFNREISHLSGTPAIDGLYPITEVAGDESTPNEGIWDVGQPVGFKYDGDNKSFNLYTQGFNITNPNPNSPRQGMANIYTGIFELR